MPSAALYRRLVVIMIGICVGWFSPRAAYSQSSKIDFASHIQPILATKCYGCHGPTMRAGGVRFDQKASVKTGGYSQHPLLGGTLKTNEIYLRVASQDPSYRMPKGKPALSASEIELFRRWVEAGTPWPTGQASVEDLAKWRAWFSRDAWLDYLDRWLNEVPGLIPWLCVMLGLQFVLLFVERYKQAVQTERAWALSSRFHWLKPLQRVGALHYLVVTLMMVLVLSFQVIRGLQAVNQGLIKSSKELRIVAGNAGQPSTFSVYGNPPIPLRPNHPPRLTGLYYRGNCERNPQLFNGGNYRTAMLSVSLVDLDGRLVTLGDHVLKNGLAVRFELERAKGTTETLFGDNISKGVILTKQVLTETLVPITDPIVRMRMVNPGWKWEAIVPLNGPLDEDVTTMAGLVYVYHGAVEDDRARGTVHYGIKYDLRLNDLNLQPESEVWLGTLFWTSALETPLSGRVPLSEWFNHQPLPEITGPNSTDPKLLGIPEHLQKQPANTPPPTGK